MKIGIKFIFMLSGLVLSCNKRTNTLLSMQPSQLKKDLFVQQKALRETSKDGTISNASSSELEPDQSPVNDVVCRIGSISRSKMKLLNQILNWSMLKSIEDIIQYNSVDYRFMSSSLSLLYADRYNLLAHHHNKFLDYIMPSHAHTSQVAIQLKNLLEFVVFSKSPKVVLEFINALSHHGIKVDIHRKDLFGMSVLEYAIASGQKEMVKVLIEKAPLVHSDGKDTALNLPYLLDWAICLSTPEIIEVLIQAGAHPSRLYDGAGAGQHGNGLRHAVVYDRKDMARYFIDEDHIQPNQSDAYCQTPLMYVADSRYPGWCKILIALLEKGGAITATDIDGKNVLMHLLTRYTDICRKYHESHDQFLDGYNCRYGQAEAILKQLFKDKQTMLACLLKQKDLSRIINAQDKKGKTLLAYFDNLISVIPDEIYKKEIVSIKNELESKMRLFPE